MKRVIFIFTAIVLSVAFLLLGCLPDSKQVSSTATVQQPIILLDAGHGGVDGGAVAADGTVEKHINLEIAQRLKPLLVLLGYSVQTTRESDISIHDMDAASIRQKKNSDLKNRLTMLEQGQAQLMLSIHQNSFSQSKYSGTQVFYGANNEDGQIYAKAIQRSVKQLLQPQNNRTVKRSGKSIYILYRATRPAVMVECGFLSNPAERELLKSDSYQQKLCFCIACGLINAKEV